MWGSGNPSRLRAAYAGSNPALSSTQEHNGPSRRSENARVLSVVCRNKHKFNASGAVPIIGYYRHSFLIPTGPRASAAAAGAVSLKTPETAPTQDS